jgi:hypothetical protein
MAAGDQSGTWGDTTNTNLGTLIEEAIAGLAEVSMTSDTDYTLTTNNGATDEARQMILRVSSTVSLTATRNVIIPAKEKLYVVHNATSGSQSILVKTSSGTGITIANGKRSIIYCDANNTHLASTVTTAASDITGVLAIANGGTGLSSAGSNNEVLTSNGSAFSMAQLTSSNFTTATANGLVPAGTIITFGGASAPTGYLNCDGAAVSRTTYASLFTALSTTWGAGDGSSTFNVPDLRDDFIRGAGNSYSVGGSQSESQYQRSVRNDTTYGTSEDGDNLHWRVPDSTPWNPGGSGEIVLGVNSKSSGGPLGGTWSNMAQAQGVGQANEVRPRNKHVLFCIKY